MIKKCPWARNNPQVFKKGMTPWNKGLIIKTKHICKFCNKEFVRNKTQAKFCSQECSQKSQLNIKRSLETINRLKISHLGKKHTEEQKIKIGLKSKGHKVTDEMKHKISVANSGSNCGAWKGGVSTENELQRKCMHAREWRRSIFIRDEFTCKECGAKETYIEAHHILPFAIHKDKRFDINNGVTLCKPCHKKKHYKGK